MPLPSVSYGDTQVSGRSCRFAVKFSWYVSRDVHMHGRYAFGFAYLRLLLRARHSTRSSGGGSGGGDSIAAAAPTLPRSAIHGGGGLSGRVCIGPPHSFRPVILCLYFGPQVRRSQQPTQKAPVGGQHHTAKRGKKDSAKGVSNSSSRFWGFSRVGKRFVPSALPKALR